MVVTPINDSCKKVLYLEMAVGLTSAEGMLKSQKRTNVFCGPRDTERRPFGLQPTLEAERRERARQGRAQRTHRRGESDVPPVEGRERERGVSADDEDGQGQREGAVHGERDGECGHEELVGCRI